nr:RNA-directed DNA polymerase, eukaryota [Tanacetum cinerariifolium]
METIRSNYFKGADHSDRKISWVSWEKVLASKQNGGLGVSSFYALNRMLLLKWVWHFISQDGSLWYRVTQAFYGSSFDLHSVHFSSLWCSILRKTYALIPKDFNFISHCKKRIGGGRSTRFWYDPWVSIQPLHVIPVRDGAEHEQWSELCKILEPVILSSSKDRWTCDLNGDEEFHAKEVRSLLDNIFLPSANVPTRWVKFIPIKINIFAWRARLDRLPTRSNLMRRGVVMDSDLCLMCGTVTEDIFHVLFRCDLAALIFRKICRWWELDCKALTSFEDWNVWFSAMRLSSKIKSMLEGVCYVAWLHLWWGLMVEAVFGSDVEGRLVGGEDDWWWW